jgi:polysaccharide export outer membrane protein
MGPGDVLNIVVWNETALSGPVTVRPDGFITLPLVNEVQVAGMTTAQLRELLNQKFGAFVMSPSVTVRVETIASSELIVVGQVTKPGVYPALGNDSLLHVLTKAGGLTIFADRQNIRVVRRLREKVTEYIVDYDAILKGDLQQDILLRPGDRIIVP